MTSNKISTSLDWSPIEIDLYRKTYKLIHGWEIRRMIDNINAEVSELSKAEVLARRGNRHLAVDILKKINEDIETIEGFLLVAALLG